MIPESKFFQSDELNHDLNSHFNPPGLTNFIGVAQVDNDLTGVRGLNFPPFGTSLNRTCGLYLDGVYFPSKNIPVSFQWRPDRIIRKTKHDGIEYQTDTMLLGYHNALIIRFRSKNTSGVFSCSGRGLKYIYSLRNLSTLILPSPSLDMSLILILIFL